MAKSVFNTLSTLDVSQHIKVLQRQNYISWADSWNEVKKIYPSAKYKVHEDQNGNPFFVSSIGIFVKVTVKIEDEEQTINYPVLNSANKALKVEPYSYKVKEYINGKPTGNLIDKYVEGATSFDVNTAIMRALTKCIALHGLGLYIYRDEITPNVETVDSSQLQAMLDLMKVKGLSPSTVAKAWNIEKIAQLHSANFDTMMDWLKGQ